MKNNLKKLVFITFTTYISLFADSNWDNLLHYRDSENQVISREFFLSDIKNPTPNQELLTIIELLNSTNGNEIACNFPARYTYIKNNKYDIPNFNLQECQGLNAFVNTFSKDKVSLVFTSEYTNNPSSAFGHTMLLFSEDNKSLDIGNAIHFAAKTNKDDGFFKYSYKGFNGKYNGYFIREPFYKKIYEYNILEQRYMYVYQLNYTKSDILFLLYHLYEIRKATFKYYFLDGNCATQTSDLLNVISSYKRESSIYYLPIDTIKKYKKNILSETKYIPLINKLYLLTQQMTKEERDTFNDVVLKNKDINDNYPDIIKEALVYYTTFNFRRFHKVYKNYNNIMEQTYLKNDLKENSLTPLNKTQPSNLGFGVFNEKNDNYLQIHYRPLFTDIFDIQSNYMQESAINTFTFDIIMNKDSIKLQQFDLINIKSFPTQLSYYKPISWAIYTGLNRKNKYNQLKLNTEAGLGRTIKIYNRSTLNFLGYLGLDNMDIYVKPNVNMTHYINNNIKVALSIESKQYYKESYTNYMVYSTWKNNNLIYQIKYESNEYSNKTLISLKYNY